jgi:N-acetylneuraminic acid mutarotase
MIEPVSGIKPEGRWQHSMSFVPSILGIAIAGGASADLAHIFDDVLIYSVGGRRWTRLMLLGQFPEVYAHQSVCHKNQLIILGGINHAGFSGFSPVVVRMKRGISAIGTILRDSKIKLIQ